MAEELEILSARRQLIVDRLATYGIDQQITFLPYLDFSNEEFQTPYEVGCRIIILWIVSYLASYPNEKQRLEDWLKKESLWDRVSENEALMFTEDPPKNKIDRFSWQIEAALVLAWCVNIIEVLPDLYEALPDDEMEAFTIKLPLLKDPKPFLTSLRFRNKEEILTENIINELITSRLRDRLFSDKEYQKPNVNVSISFERHYALNWLRMFSGISEWDETDTST
jgi:hypothetical protein